MWYYGDLTIYGENRINNLVPGKDVINKGIDYYNCFYTLYHKLYAHFENECRDSYPLLEYDLFTIWNLAYSRQENKSKLLDKYFFYSQDENEMEIYEHIKEILDKYIKNYCDVRISMAEEKEYDKEKIMNNFDITGISYQKRPLEEY